MEEFRVWIKYNFPSDAYRKQTWYEIYERKWNLFQLKDFLGS